MLKSLQLWHDTTPRDGPLNMALDEAMLEAAHDPCLRVYHWSEATISIGFSQPLSMIPESKKHWPVVRRWTGGGVVVHDGDWTYTLAIPAGHVVCDQKPAETYRWIHEAMIAAFVKCGITDCALQSESVSDGMGVCFDEPARFDVVQGGLKMAGAAQRRSKHGFLHQGTVQPLRPPDDFAAAFASVLATEVISIAQHRAESLFLSRAQSVAAVKYGAASWLHERLASSAKAPA